MNPINTQPIEKPTNTHGHTLDVQSVFYTIQGEGVFTGRPAVFIRLAGCNLQCPGCDTDYTSNRQQLTSDEIVGLIEKATFDIAFKAKPLVVITGGEPFRQNLVPLLYTLAELCFPVQIETNGTLAIPQEPVFEDVTIVCSPKAGKVHPTVSQSAYCYKYVLNHRSVSAKDGLPLLALGHSAAPFVARPTRQLPIYLQPMDCGNDIENRLNLDAVIESCMKYGYTLQLQVHKILEMA